MELTCDDLDAGVVASVDHVGVLIPVAALRGESIGNRLIVGPPLGAGNVFLGGTR